MSSDNKSHENSVGEEMQVEKHASLVNKAISIEGLPFKDLSIRIDPKALGKDGRSVAPIRITYDPSMMTEELKKETAEKGKRNYIAILPEKWNDAVFYLREKIIEKVNKEKEKLKANGVRKITSFDFNIEVERVPMRCCYSLSLGEFDGAIDEGYLNEVVIVRRGRVSTPSIDDLLLPQFIKYRLKEAIKRVGLVLIVGSTGAGKTTTMAALEKHFLECRGGRFIECGNPIEFPLRKNFPSSHPFAEAIQKEVSSYEEMIGEAKNMLRMAPDGCGFTEVREGELGSIVLNIATSGHFTITTFHASSPKQAIMRLKQMCLNIMGEHVWSVIADSLQLIIYQEKDENGRVLVKIFDMSLFEKGFEKTVRHAIGEGRLVQWEGEWEEKQASAWRKFNEEQNIQDTYEMSLMKRDNDIPTGRKSSPSTSSAPASRSGSVRPAVAPQPSGVSSSGGPTKAPLRPEKQPLSGSGGLGGFFGRKKR